MINVELDIKNHYSKWNDDKEQQIFRDSKINKNILYTATILPPVVCCLFKNFILLEREAWSFKSSSIPPLKLQLHFIVNLIVWTSLLR